MLQYLLYWGSLELNIQVLLGMLVIWWHKPEDYVWLFFFFCLSTWCIDSVESDRCEEILITFASWGNFNSFFGERECKWMGERYRDQLWVNTWGWQLWENRGTSMHSGDTLQSHLQVLSISVACYLKTSSLIVYSFIFLFSLLCFNLFNLKLWYVFFP